MPRSLIYLIRHGKVEEGDISLSKTGLEFRDRLPRLLSANGVISPKFYYNSGPSRVKETFANAAKVLQVSLEPIDDADFADQIIETIKTNTKDKIIVFGCRRIDITTVFRWLSSNNLVPDTELMYKYFFKINLNRAKTPNTVQVDLIPTEQVSNCFRKPYTHWSFASGWTIPDD